MGMSNDVEVNVFDRALQLAGKSSMNQKHGAVILGRNGEIIGEGFNHFSSFMCHSWSCHAEIAALLSIKNKKEKLVDATLVVVRLGSDNEPKLSKPCDKCRKEINKFGIKKVFYST
jgi:deoxycytidylate deaminase